MGVGEGKAAAEEFRNSWEPSQTAKTGAGRRLTPINTEIKTEKIRSVGAVSICVHLRTSAAEWPLNGF
jgi:hypothetical protein